MFIDRLVTHRMILLAIALCRTPGCQLGTAHPPGYPTFTIITYLISLLPVSANVAYRMNVFSAVCGSLCSAIITHIVDVLTPGSESAAPAIAAGLFATISPLAWTYHVTAEVFALNNALVAVILLCLVKYMKDKEDDKWMYLGALFCGFGLTNQHTSILLIVPGVATMIYVGKVSPRQNGTETLRTSLLILCTLHSSSLACPSLPCARPFSLPVSQATLPCRCPILFSPHPDLSAFLFSPTFES